MAAPTRTPRRRWIDEGLRALAAGGQDAVRIEPLAKALGVTRGGFYWHFEDREALLTETLDTWNARAPPGRSSRSSATVAAPPPTSGGPPASPRPAGAG